MIVDTDDLGDQVTLGAKFNVTGKAVSNWAARYDNFPTPVKMFGRHPVYLVSDVVKWYIDHFGMNKYRESKQ